MRSRTLAVLTFSCVAVISCADPNEVDVVGGLGVSAKDSVTALVQYGGAPPVELAKEYVNTPIGLLHRSCVHEVPDSAISSDNMIVLKDGTRLPIGKCQYMAYLRSRSPQSQAALFVGKSERMTRFTPGVISNLITHGFAGYTSAVPDANVCTNGNCGAGGYTDVIGWMVVPSNPSPGYSTFQKAYYGSIGLQDNPATNLLEPVIQYGNNGSWGGAYWTMVAWSCAAAPNCFHSTPSTAIQAGDTIAVSVSGYGGGSCGAGKNCWGVYLSNNSRVGSTSQIWTDSRIYKKAFGISAEVFNFAACSDYPASQLKTYNVYMRQMYEPTWQSIPAFGIQDQNPTWTPFTLAGASPSCTYSISTSVGGTSPYYTLSTLQHY
jgi:hypothetical protein